MKNFSYLAGQVLLGLSITMFGIEQLFFTHPLNAFLPPETDFFPRLPVAIGVGILFILSGFFIWFVPNRRFLNFLPTFLLSAILLVCHSPLLILHPLSGSEWTVFFELVSLGCGTALVVFIHEEPGKIKKNNHRNTERKTCKFLLALSLLVFCVLHFVYADYIATLIPSWILFPTFWAYFFGVTFLMSSVFIIVNRAVVLTSHLLAIQFLTWVIVLHLPRVINNLIESEVTSLFVALGMAAVFLLLAANEKYRPEANIDYFLPD